jgi:hypothetical protein
MGIGSWKTDRYGPANSYDALKAFALLAMAVDHVGSFLLPEADVLRAVGRLALPVFLFLVGYSGSARIGIGVGVGGLLLVATDLLTFHPVFPLNILAAVLVVRPLMALLERKRTLERAPMQLWIASAVWLLPTVLLVEYGSASLLFALCGACVRKGLRGGAYRAFFVLTFLLHAGMEYLAFEFSPVEALLMLAGLLAVGISLWRFRMFRLSDLGLRPLRFCARNTLVLYVAHVMLFQTAGYFLYPEKFTRFQWMETGREAPSPNG